MRQYKPYIISGVCLLLVMFYITCGSCKDPDPYWEGQYDILSTQLEELKLEKEAKIKDLEEKNAEKDIIIGHATKRVGNLELEIVTRNEKITELEKEYDSLGEDSAKIANLTQQVKEWKNQFSLLEKVIIEKDAIIFSLTEKYNNQVVISLDYKELYEKVQGTNILLQTGLNRANKQIIKLKVTNKIKNVACTMLAGLVLYKMVQ